MKANAAVVPSDRPALMGRWASFVEMTRPRIAALVLITVAAGGFVAARGAPDPWLLVSAILGAALAAGGANALNQWQERAIDARMYRTALRPLPSGRVTPNEALIFGVALATLGISGLLLLTNPLAALLTASCVVLYVGVYTPLKRITVLNTAVGAIPGALPPLIGWAAVTGLAQLASLAAFPDRLLLAVSPFPGHRLALSR